MFVDLVDDNMNCQTCHWSSARCHQITHSLLLSKIYVFSMGYDYRTRLKILVVKMEINVPLYLFTDSKLIFNNITVLKQLRKLRLVNEIAEIKRVYKSHEITNIACIHSPKNVSDVFTYHNSDETLSTVRRTGKLHFKIKQWAYKEDLTVRL